MNIHAEPRAQNDSYRCKWQLIKHDKAESKRPSFSAQTTLGEPQDQPQWWIPVARQVVSYANKIFVSIDMLILMFMGISVVGPCGQAGCRKYIRQTRINKGTPVVRQVNKNVDLMCIWWTLGVRQDQIEQCLVRAMAQKAIEQQNKLFCCRCES